MQWTKWCINKNAADNVTLFKSIINYSGRCFLLRALVWYIFFLSLSHLFIRLCAEHSRHWEIYFQWVTAVAFFLVEMDESNKNWNAATFHWHKQNSNELLFFFLLVFVVLKQTHKGKLIQGNIVSTHKAAAHNKENIHAKASKSNHLNRDKLISKWNFIRYV